MLYSTPMVQGILEGRKTKTRRTKGLEVINKNPNDWRFNRQTDIIDFHADNKTKIGTFIFLDNSINTKALLIECTYNVGDVLWVRETSYECMSENLKGKFYYKASMLSSWNFKWKPSIFMPKQACRIFLKIKSIRVERLQEISEEDAIAEGAIQHEKETDWLSAKYGFQMIWETINGKESWDWNPFVWVYEFERIEKPLDFI